MCGITGALDLAGLQEFPAEQLHTMVSAIGHRGPDEERFHIEPGLAMGACRLAIVDPSFGYQPISNETGEIWTSCNGELFDYPHLRKELLAKGHELKTRCDAEAWAHLYEEHGVEMFERARGQFAVALWDRGKRALLLGRDRPGICPLYYTVQNGWLLWGSEIKALLASGLVNARPDLKGLDYLFNFYGPATSRTFFEDIKLLPPGHFLQVRNGNISLHTYWDLDFPDAGEERRVKDVNLLVDEFEGLLANAVTRRLHGDVPVVCYLSGGLDSSVILETGSRLGQAPLPSFTIGMEKGTGPAEGENAREVAEFLGSRLTTLPMDAARIANAFPEFITATEGPALDVSCAALMELATAINQQGFKVALTGEGVDEALAGYIWFKGQKISNMMGAALPRIMRRLMWSTIHRGPRRGTVVPERAVKGVRPAQQLMYEALNLSREIFYSPAMWEKLSGHDTYTDLVLPNENISRWHPLNQSIYVNYKVMLAGLLLISKGDRIAMHSSVETRFPFLDEEIIQFCASIAPEYKLRGMTDKWLLRQLAARRLPAAVARRPKSMFRSKMSEIFFGVHRPAWVDQLLSPESLQRAGYFSPQAVARERARLTGMPKMMPRQYLLDAMMSCVLATQLWHHQFFGGGLCDLPVWSPRKTAQPGKGSL